MSWLGVIILAVVFGAAEIFPVSGSGHLYLLNQMLGFGLTAANLAAFRAALFAGIAIALVIFYRRQLGQMLLHLLAGLIRMQTKRRSRSMSLPGRQLLMLTVASLPMLAALLLNRLRLAIEHSTAVLAIVGAFLLLSGILLFFSARTAREAKRPRDLTIGDALVMGLAQVLSVFPGLSRVGILLSAGFIRGLDYGTALEQAGLMGVPVYFVAAIHQRAAAGRLGAVTVTTEQLLIGTALSTVIGLVTLNLLSERTARGKATGFAYWCWGAALLAEIVFLAAA